MIDARRTLVAAMGLCGALLGATREARAQRPFGNRVYDGTEDRDLRRNHFQFLTSLGVMGLLPTAPSGSAPRAVATASAGFGYSFVSWLVLSTQFRWHSGFAEECVGWEWLGEFAFRPTVPWFVQPFGYVQGGYGRFTIAPPTLTFYGVARLGGGINVPLARVVSLELRVGAQLLNGEDMPFGLDASLGITLTERPDPPCSEVAPIERLRGNCTGRRAE